MTERFMIDDCGTLIDMHTRNTYDYVSDVVTLLNELHEENKTLKTRFKEERELAMRLSRECDTLTIKKQELKKENEHLKKELPKLKLVNEMLSNKEDDWEKL